MRQSLEPAVLRRRYVVTLLVAIGVIAAAAIGVSQRSKIDDLRTKNQTLSAANAQVIRQRMTTREELDAARRDLDHRATEKAADDAEATRIEALRPPGATLFAANCASCHGRDGNGGLGPQLSDGAASKHLSEAQAVTFVTSGGIPPMPTFGEVLSPEQIQQVVTYILKL